jgi:hypothetical protein
VHGFVTWAYDCKTAIRKADEDDKAVQARIDEDPTLCERPKFYIGDSKDTPVEKSLWVVDVPRPYNALEVKRIKKKDRIEPDRCEPDEKDKSKSVCPPYAVGDEVEITGKFSIESVTIGIEDAVAGAGATSQPVSIRIYEYPFTGPTTSLDRSMLIERASLNLMIANTTATLLTKPIAADIPAASAFVVEVFVPDGETQGHQFRVGSNQEGETTPGYLAAPRCNYAQPTTIPTVLTTRKVDLVMNVTGTVR